MWFVSSLLRAQCIVLSRLGRRRTSRMQQLGVSLAVGEHKAGPSAQRSAVADK